MLLCDVKHFNAPCLLLNEVTCVEFLNKIRPYIIFFFWIAYSEESRNIVARIRTFEKLCLFYFFFANTKLWFIFKIFFNTQNHNFNPLSMKCRCNVLKKISVSPILLFYLNIIIAWRWKQKKYHDNEERKNPINI